MIISGASDASGASHWTRKNWLIWKRLPVATRPEANGSALARIIVAANKNSSAVTIRLKRVGRAANARGGPTSSGSSCSSRAAWRMYTTNIAPKTAVSNRSMCFRITSFIAHSVAMKRKPRSVRRDPGSVTPFCFDR